MHAIFVCSALHYHLLYSLIIIVFGSLCNTTVHEIELA